jgi:hypothetical protein
VGQVRWQQRIARACPGSPGWQGWQGWRRMSTYRPRRRRAKHERKFVRIRARPEVGIDELTPIASALINTSPGPGEGVGRSTFRNTSGPARFRDFDGVHGRDSNGRPPPCRCSSGQRRGRGGVSSSNASVVVPYIYRRSTLSPATSTTPIRPTRVVDCASYDATTVFNRARGIHRK